MQSNTYRLITAAPLFVNNYPVCSIYDINEKPMFLSFNEAGPRITLSQQDLLCQRQVSNTRLDQPHQFPSKTEIALVFLPW